MKLLVDCIPFDDGKSGISVYIREVVRALAAEGHELTLLLEPNANDPAFEGHAVIRAPGYTRKAVFSMLWHLYVLPRKLKWKRFNAFLVLAANRRMPGKLKLPTVAVVHDLSQYHVEAKYDAFRMFYIKRLLPHYVRKAHRVVAISKSTANDLIAHWRIPERKVAVVYNGFTPPATIQNGDSTHLNPQPSTLNSSPTPILYISRIEHPGKNHVNLIEAYSQLPRALAERHPLVLAGKDWPGAECVHAAAEASPHRDLIRFTGFIGDADLAKLWCEAACYVFPSRFEGFGLSLLEAMAAGVPCACSNTSSLGELGAGVAELFDPESPGEIARALTRILEGDNTARIAAGREKAAGFSWDRCAKGLLGAFPKGEVFGVPVHCDTMAEAVRRVTESRFDPVSPRPKYFAFVNAHCLNVAWSDSEYKDILLHCDRVWPDGTGVRMAGARLGFPVPENVNGTDLFPLLSGRVFLYGAAPGVAEKAAEAIREKYPKMEVVGCDHGYGDDRAVIEHVNQVKPDILLVALGVPRQEKWIAVHRDELAAGCVIAVGGLLDFVSGRIPRAPMWMRRLGVEWIFRLLQEPRRMFRRYIIGNPLFLSRVKRQERNAR